MLIDTSTKFYFWLSAIITIIVIENDFKLIDCGPIRVKIYDHRAEHDPKHLYGTGPWKYHGYGYGIEYQYEPDGSYQREKGYGYLKIFGRDFCKYRDKSKCRRSSSEKENVIPFNRGEPFWGQPSAEIIRDHDNMEKRIPNSSSREKVNIKGSRRKRLILVKKVEKRKGKMMEDGKKLIINSGAKDYQMFNQSFVNSKVNRTS